MAALCAFSDTIWQVASRSQVFSQVLISFVLSPGHSVFVITQRETAVSGKYLQIATVQHMYHSSLSSSFHRRLYSKCIVEYYNLKQVLT